MNILQTLLDIQIGPLYVSQVFFLTPWGGKQMLIYYTMWIREYKVKPSWFSYRKQPNNIGATSPGEICNKSYVAGIVMVRSFHLLYVTTFQQPYYYVSVCAVVKWFPTACFSLYMSIHCYSVGTKLLDSKNIPLYHTFQA